MCGHGHDASCGRDATHKAAHEAQPARDATRGPDGHDALPERRTRRLRRVVATGADGRGARRGRAGPSATSASGQRPEGSREAGSRPSSRVVTSPKSDCALAYWFSEKPHFLRFWKTVDFFLSRFLGRLRRNPT